MRIEYFGFSVDYIGGGIFDSREFGLKEERRGEIYGKYKITQRIHRQQSIDYQIPDNASDTLTPSQIIFCYLAYVESRAKIPSQIQKIDWAKVDKLYTDEKALKQEEDDLSSAINTYTEKTAELNTKKPQRESSLESLLAKRAELESTLASLKKEKKPDETKIQEVQDELDSTNAKITTAQNSLTNINERLAILATLYDITTGEGLTTELITLIPNHKLAKQKAWYLEYEIPKRKENLAKLKAELEKEQDAEKRAELENEIQNLEKLISEKELALSEAIDTRDLLAPQLESAREQYASAKEKLEKLQASPTKTLDMLYPSEQDK